MRMTINKAITAATATFIAGWMTQGLVAVLSSPWSRTIKSEAGMNVRIKCAFSEGPVNILAGQTAGPAVISKPRLRNQKEIAEVNAAGMSVPP